MSVELIREGKVSLRFNISDVSVNRVSLAFQVEASTIFLKEEFGDLCYWPNEAGRFNLQQVGSCLQVMGEPLSEQPQSSTSSIPPAASSALSYAPVNSKPGPSGLNPVAPKSAWGKKATFSCKIVFATMQRNAKGVAQFTEVKQSYITLDEQSANITEVTAKAKFKFGEEVILVAGNGLPIEDEPGTRGSSFWKCGSRKLYAIPMIKKRQVLSSDDSEDDYAPKKKRYSGKGKSPAVADIKEELASLITNTNEIKEQIADIVKVSKGLKVPLSVIKLVKDTFKCKICHSSPMVPPIIASRCCNTLLSCNKCINTWYAGDDGLEKSCPNCREARGYAHTVHFKGLDDFMVAMSKIIDDNDDNESTDEYA